MGDNSKGEMSEWNEGDYKNLRLHKAQEIINAGSLSPTKQIILFGIMKFGYEFIFDGINILYGEGMSKYSSDEVIEIDKLRDDVEKKIKTKPVHKIINNHRGKSGYSIHLDNWDELKKDFRNFEYKVKKFNDDHGLSTRNREEDEGL